MAINTSVLTDVLEKFRQECASSNGPQVFQFADARTIFPILDLGTGSYLTSSMCMLYLPGKNDPPKTLSMSSNDLEVKDVEGWKIITIVIPLGTTAVAFWKKLHEAKEKLLKG